MLGRIGCFVLAVLTAPLVPVTIKAIPDLPITYFGILELLCWMGLVMLETGAVIFFLAGAFAGEPHDEHR